VLLLALALLPRVATAQTQVRARVLLMVDTSGSMLQRVDTSTENATNNTGGDGSFSYTDALMSRDTSTFGGGFAMYHGFQTNGPNCTLPTPGTITYNTLGRMTNAKLAVQNVINGSGDIDWGLMRYAGSDCTRFSSTFAATVTGCRRDADCPGLASLCQTPGARTGVCTCVDEADCFNGDYCNGGLCGRRPDMSNYPTTAGCTGGVLPGSGGAPQPRCLCNNDSQCPNGAAAGAVPFCMPVITPTTVGGTPYTGICALDNNLCAIGNPADTYSYGNTDARGSGVCGNTIRFPVTWNGGCGHPDGNTTSNSGCRTLETCYQDTDCHITTAGTCANIGTGPAKSCTCSSNADCNTNYNCINNRCRFSLACRDDGGNIVVDPSQLGVTNNSIFPYIDGIEDFTDNGSGKPKNPELRASGSTPLGGAARTATTWYKNLTDAQKACRPYVLVLLTDGEDSCEAGAGGDDLAGAISGAEGFVAASVDNTNSNINKVYVIGLAFSNGTNLDKIATAGGTGKARLANSQDQIQAALADIVQSSILVEKCNYKDDDCNGICDEPFPDVERKAGCPARQDGTRAAHQCNSGYPQTTKCYRTADYVCSQDGLSQVCSLAACMGASASLAAGSTGTRERLNGVDTTAMVVGDIIQVTGASASVNNGRFPVAAIISATAVEVTNNAFNSGNLAGTISWSDKRICPTSETCNDGIDDDCDGVIDDCTPGVANSCPSCVACPSCNLAGTPQPETCNGCDDDCDGVVDNHLIDTGGPCGSSVGTCMPGQFYCCQEGSPTTLNCTQNTTTNKPPGANNDHLVCLGGVGPSPEICDTLDNDCNGIPDDGASQSCFEDTLGNPLMGTPGVGICKNGTKPCPGVPGACIGAVGKQPEVCNTLDDDCNGTVDDITPTECCPTGNLSDCDGAVMGTPCHRGHLKCDMGKTVCDGAVAKSPETCDMKDNDCDGTVDNNIPGAGSPCVDSNLNNKGECRTIYACLASAGSGPNGLTCTQASTPKPELCNNKDDDCDGTVDNHLMDPAVGVSGGPPCVPLPAGQMMDPCKPGVTACVNGMVVCEGEVGPQANQCDGISRDCTGKPNTNGNCPIGFQCLMGNCLQPCASGEFPCPGGFICDQTTRLCVSDACAKVTCTPGDVCEVGDDGKGSCIDPCTHGVTCGAGSVCMHGVCVDNTCRSMGCPAGQVCLGSPPACVADPCAGVVCNGDQYCSNGQCVGTCPSVCMRGDACIDGMCQKDPCDGVNCIEGQVCAVVAGMGTCVVNRCEFVSCNPGAVCCGGTCIADPCAGISCPGSASCVRNSACQAACQDVMRAPPDQVVGAGGGGFACSTAGGRGGDPRSLGTLLLLVGLAAVRSRGRRTRARGVR
jgi:hypothetical protein